MHSIKVLPMILIALIACGPPRLPTGSDDDSTDSESSGAEPTSSTTTEPEPLDTETDTETESESGSVPFVPDYDDVLGDDCDPWLQDCIEGEKCVPYSVDGGGWNGTKCVPILGDQAAGEPCEYAGAVEATDDCDGSSVCWNVDADGVGVCHAMCSGMPEMPICPPEAHCLSSGNGVINLCILHCDPLLQDCPESLGCYWTGGDEFDCAPTTSDLPAGEPCSFVNDCAIGHVCVPADQLPACEGVSCCTWFCDLGELEGHCDGVPGTECVPFFEGRSPPQYDTIGVCIVP